MRAKCVPLRAPTHNHHFDSASCVDDVAFTEALIDSIETFSGSVQQLEHLLMTQNLISGVTAG